MPNKYLNFISDEHLLDCIANLHKSYLKAKNNITKKKFYKNKVDVIKLTFDSKLNDIDEESLIQAEILRQIDKSINNSIGTFHEQILSGINGYEIVEDNFFDKKSTDGTVYFDIHYNPIKRNLFSSQFERLADLRKYLNNLNFIS